VRFDPIILGMVPSDLEAVLSMVIRDHLTCECVDRRDVEAHADHLAEEIREMLQTPPDPDGSWTEYARSIAAPEERENIK